MPSSVKKPILKRHDSPVWRRCWSVPRSSTNPAAPVIPIIASGSRMDLCSRQSTAIAVTMNVGTQMMKPPNVGVPAFTWCDSGWYSPMLFPAFCARRYRRIGAPSTSASTNVSTPRRVRGSRCRLQLRQDRFELRPARGFHEHDVSGAHLTDDVISRLFLRFEPAHVLRALPRAPPPPAAHIRRRRPRARRTMCLPPFQPCDAPLPRVPRARPSAR